MKLFFAIFLFIIHLSVFAQDVELAIQRGHSNDIQHIAFSSNGELLASFGLDKQLVIWDIRKGKEIVSISVNYNLVKGIGFTNDSKKVVVQTSNGLKCFTILNSFLSDYHGINGVDFFINNKNSYLTSDKKFEIDITKAKLIKRDLSTGKIVFKKNPDYFDEYFTAVDVSEKNNLIVAANADGKVYLFDLANGNKYKDIYNQKIRSLSGHLSNINDIAFSPDQMYFATASSDRSIILWNVKSMKIVKRLFAQSFRNFSLAFSDDGKKLAIGNEIGQVKVINLASSDLAIQNFNLHAHTVSNLHFFGENRILSSGFDNKILLTETESSDDGMKWKYMTGINKGNLINGFFQNIMKYYRQPYAYVTRLSKNNSNTLIAFSGNSKKLSHSYIKLIKMDGNKTYKLIKHIENVSDLKFFNDTTLISADGSQIVNSWVMSGNEFYFREIVLPINVAFIYFISENNILIGNDKVVAIYNTEKASIVSLLNLSIKQHAYNSNSSQLLIADELNQIHLYNLENLSFSEEFIFKGHSDEINSMAFNPVKNIFASAGNDASVKIWDLATGELIISFIPIGKDDRIGLTAENYYLISKNNLNSVGFKIGESFVLAEQFDLHYNRPDVVLGKLNFLDSKTIAMYRSAGEKRSKQQIRIKLSAQINNEIPKVVIKNAENIPFITKSENIEVQIHIYSENTFLKSFNVFVNNVPVYGTKGIVILDRGLANIDTSLYIRLSEGLNKIQITAYNANELEAYRESFEIEKQSDKRVKPNLYLTVLSVADYSDNNLDLKYSVKDGRDMIKSVSEKSPLFQNIVIDSLFNQNVSKENLVLLKNKLLNTNPEDVVILFISGHGFLDKNYDFWFAQNNFDIENPTETGIAYHELESVLDSIPSRKKLLLMDACHSGMVDKESLVIIDSLQKSMDKSIVFRDIRGAGLVTNQTISLDNSFLLMQELFVNLNKGSGTHVISAAAGDSYALESDKWNNGVFTFSVLSGLNKFAADENHDKLISVSELKKWVSREVVRLTNGAQKPTSRQENPDFDFNIK